MPDFYIVISHHHIITVICTFPETCKRPDFLSRPQGKLFAYYVIVCLRIFSFLTISPAWQSQRSLILQCGEWVSE